MKKIFLVLFLLFPTMAAAKLKVVTTIPDLATLAREVGQDLVDVQSIARGDQDPHYLEPKPSFVVTLNRADLLIEVGLELEVGWLPVLLTQSRNPKVQRGQPGHLDASVGLRILEIPTGQVDRSMGDIHPAGNPHYWLDPHNGILIARRISEHLSRLDEANAPTYGKNLEVFEKRLRERIAQWERESAPLRGRSIVTHHKSFSYFVNWVGLKVEGLIEPKPGIPPNPAHILKLLQLIPAKKIPLIITENYYDPKPSRELSEKTGSKVLILPTSVGGEPTVTTYEELFDFLLRKIREVL